MKNVVRVLLCGLLVCTGASAADVVKREQLELIQGAPVKKMSGKIKGYDSVEYSIAVPAGGNLDLKLKSANPSSYFNVTGADADEALFVGSRDGDHFSVTAQSDANYKVSVYLMRNAARKKQTANYVLEAGIR